MEGQAAGDGGDGDRLLGVGGSLGWLRGNEPTRAEEARGEVGLSRCARWGWVIASKARFGSLPLLPRLGRGVWRGRLQRTVGTGDRLLGVGGSLVGWLRGNEPTRPEEARGRGGFRAVRDGVG